MPFAEVQRPRLRWASFAYAAGAWSSEVVYANFGLAETIGLVAYQAMQSTPTDHLLGEWCFAGTLFPTRRRPTRILDMVLDVRCHGFPAELAERRADALGAPPLRRVRRAPRRRDRRAAPEIVGCSSVFQQHCASLALLKRIRERSPDTVLLMGGANCEEMGVETLRSFPWVDCVVSGEADAIFADLCRLLLEHGRDADPASLPDGALAQRRPLPSTESCWQARDLPAVIRDLDSRRRLTTTTTSRRSAAPPSRT